MGVHFCVHLTKNTKNKKYFSIFLLNCSRNFRYLSKLPHSGRMSIANHSSHHVQFKTYAPFRFKASRQGDKIEQVLAHEIKQSRNVTQLVRPLLFTIGVREF